MCSLATVVESLNHPHLWKGIDAQNLLMNTGLFHASKNIQIKQSEKEKLVFGWIAHNKWTYLTCDKCLHVTTASFLRFTSPEGLETLFSSTKTLKQAATSSLVL